MKYGLFVYEHSNNNLINIGDYIQSIAAKQFLPKIDTYLERDHLNDYNEDKIKLIMNGWFGYKPENWPPSKKISPFYVSFHLNKNISSKLMSDSDVVNHFKLHEPIGCRDNDTLKSLSAKGIVAYRSGCLTTTLNYDGKLFDKGIIKNNEILLVDVLFKENVLEKIRRNYLNFFKEVLKGNLSRLNKVNKYLESLVPGQFNKNIEILTCYFSSRTTHLQRFDHARNLLYKLACAKVVVTSRIHIALPCLALGTPVLFVLGEKLLDEEEFKRLDGIVNKMNILVDNKAEIEKKGYSNLRLFSKKEIDWANPPANPDLHLNDRKELIKKTESFISMNFQAEIE